jgi:hypothetical protein
MFSKINKDQKVKPQNKKKSVEKNTKIIKNTKFRISKLKKIRNSISNTSIKRLINLSEFKKSILSLNYDDNIKDEIKKILLKSHFLNIIKQRKVKLIENKKESEKPKKLKKMSEETYLKLKTRKLTIVYNTIQRRPNNLKNDISFHNNKNYVSEDDFKDILVIDFEGVLGYTRTNEKGYIEFIYLKNLAVFFKKLKKHYHIVVIFKRINKSDYYRKIMDFIQKFDNFVKVFAVVLNLKDKNKNEENLKVKIGSFSRMTPKDSRKMANLSNKPKVINELFVDIKDIEQLFPKNKKIVFFSTLNKDINQTGTSNFKISLIIKCCLFILS